MSRRTVVRVDLAIVLTAALACSDPVPPEPEVVDIVLSVADSGITLGFRQQVVVTASPQAALGVPLLRDVSWQPLNPSLVAVDPLNPRGDSVRLRPTGVGTGDVQVRAGEFARTFRVTVKDTVYSVTVTPGPLALVAGDTATFSATVPHSESADPSVEWEISDPGVLRNVFSSSSMIHVQAIASGLALVKAVSTADATKRGSASVAAQVGRLSFFAEPTTTPRDVPFLPRISVVVHDAAGQVSPRAANLVTVSVDPLTCGPLRGTLTRQVAGGLAEFPDIRPGARCGHARLTATSEPAATGVTSQSFDVIARHCGATAPLGFNQTTQATFEAVDCVVSRNGVLHYAHTYDLTVPVDVPRYVLELDALSAGFGPRIVASLWADTAATWTDSLPGQPPWYVLGPGTYRFRIMSPVPGGGPYTLSVGQGNFFNGAGPCRIAASTGFSANVNIGPCPIPFASRTGQGDGRVFVVYLPAGKSITVTNRLIDNNTRDAYLEVIDITSPTPNPVVVASDDNSGGGTLGRDARLTVNPASAGRYLEVRAMLYGPGTGFYFNVTITP